MTLAQGRANMATLKRNKQPEIEMNYTFTVDVPDYFVENIKSTFSRITGKKMTEDQFTDTMTGLIRDMGVFLEDEVLEEWLYEDFGDQIEDIDAEELFVKDNELYYL